MNEKHRLSVSRLTLTDFRNHAALDLGAAPLAARDHALRALVGFGLRICDRGRVQPRV